MSFIVFLYIIKMRFLPMSKCTPISKSDRENENRFLKFTYVSHFYQRKIFQKDCGEFII